MSSPLPLEGLPMQETLVEGLSDLAGGQLDTIPALLLRIGAYNLALAGLHQLKPYVGPSDDPEDKLFLKLRKNTSTHRQACAQYNALINELCSLESAALHRARRLGLRVSARNF